uniref:Chromosome 16 C7orf31 homolog n=1 Tax=Mastacembelus armatus TaxID=205130 RepID=A0A3Q3M2E9_9TELE
STSRRKSNVRLNDQLERLIKIAIPKEHPQSSHICRFAMFPSFHSPDDPCSGVRAASQSFLNPSIPNSPADVTLLSKTIGGPYRHEMIETPMKTRKKAALWSGEHGFLDVSNKTYGVFYPTPPKTVLPNPQLRDWDLSLSERTSNMLRNQERTHWLTSYQMDYTGNELFSLQRERSYPVFVPSTPKQGCRRRQQSHVGRSTCSPTAPQLLNPCPAPSLSTALTVLHQHRPQEITAKHNEAPDLNPKGHSQSENSTGSTETWAADLSQELLYKQQPEHRSSLYEGKDREDSKVQFDDSLWQVSLSQSGQEANSNQAAETGKYPLSQGEVDADRKKSMIEHSRAQYFKAGRNSSSDSQLAAATDRAGADSHAESKATGEHSTTHSITKPCILPRPPVQTAPHPVDRVGSLGRQGVGLSLLDLQHSFSKSEAHRNFIRSITPAAVNLRDNVITGKKHNFYGVNCCYLHG